MIWFYLVPAILGVVASAICVIVNYVDWKSAVKNLANARRQNLYSVEDRRRMLARCAYLLKMSFIWLIVSLFWPLFPLWGIVWLFKNLPSISRQVNRHIAGEFE